MAGIYSRDIDIGKFVEAPSAEKLLPTLKEGKALTEEALQELKKISAGTSLMLGQEVEEPLD